MSLPFLKSKPVAGVIMHQQRKAEGGMKSEPTPDDAAAPLEACAGDLLAAVHSRDVKAIAAALKAAYDVCQSSPEDSNDFDSQNQKAAE